MNIPEPDWKIFKKYKEIALERFSQRILDECQDICNKASLTAHNRYLKLYKVIQKRDKEIVEIFNDFRRSTAIIRIMQMRAHNLLTEEEISEFSPEIQEATNNKW